MAKRKKKRKKRRKSKTRRRKKTRGRKKKKTRRRKKVRRRKNKRIKRRAKKKRSKKGRKKKRGGTGNQSFMQPATPSAAFAEVVGKKPLPRTKLVRKLWNYIKKKRLQDKKDRRVIVCDDKLKAMFKKKKVDMFQMNKLLKRHMKIK